MFTALKEQKALVCLWQIKTDADGKTTRNIQTAFISANTKELESLQFQHELGTEFGFTGELVYVYSEGYKTAFKAILLECSGSMLTLGYPKEMVMLPYDGDEFTPPKSYLDKYNLMRGEGKTERFDEFLKVRGYKEMASAFMEGKSKTEHIQTVKIESISVEPSINKSNSKHFLGMRESPRLAPKKDKYATVRRDDGTEGTFRVLDLSRGGAGLALLEETDLTKGQNIEIIGMDGKPLKKTLKGQIMAIRKTEDGTLKAGIKFVVEEDIPDAA